MTRPIAEDCRVMNCTVKLQVVQLVTFTFAPFKLLFSFVVVVGPGGVQERLSPPHLITPLGFISVDSFRQRRGPKGP